MRNWPRSRRRPSPISQSSPPAELGLIGSRCRVRACQTKRDTRRSSQQRGTANPGSRVQMARVSLVSRPRVRKDPLTAQPMFATLRAQRLHAVRKPVRRSGL
jgi:hypothetical protein